MPRPDTVVAWVVAQPDYDSYEVIAIFTDKEDAECFHRELDLTPKGRSRGMYSVDAYPLNPNSPADAREIANGLPL